MFKKNTIGAYLLMYMYMFILKIPLNPPQHVGVGGAWYECALYMDCESLLCYVKFRDIIQPNLSVHLCWQLTHVPVADLGGGGGGFGGFNPPPPTRHYE